MKLFAQKGFHETSVQAIVDNSGVSKGSFYLHFDSKEDLLFHIHHYYYYGLMDAVKEVQNHDAEPREQLALQVKVLLQSFMSNKDFIVMHMRENVNVPLETSGLLTDIQRHSYEWARGNLLNIYGKPLQSKINDAVILLEGILHGYVKWLVIDEVRLDADVLSNFIVRRIDDVIAGMIGEEHEPLISDALLQEHFPGNVAQGGYACVQRELQRMREKIDYVNATEQQKQDLCSAMNVLEEEMKKAEPQHVIVQGMLTHFAHFPPFKPNLQQISKYLEITLLT